MLVIVVYLLTSALVIYLLLLDIYAISQHISNCTGISDVAGCISAKGNCVNAYGNKLDCECVLTGQGGGCSAELRQIFGNNAFHHCSDANFQQVLTAICGAISTANTISKTVLPDISQGIQDLRDAEQKNNGQLDQDMNEIINKLQDAKNKSDQAKQTIVLHNKKWVI